MKAVILCAGFGTRMNEYTKTCPKPMLPVGGKPLLHRTIEKLRMSGVMEIGINLHYLADVIKHSLGDGSRFGVKISYIYEEEPSGTAGGVLKLSEFLVGCEHFWVVYGDIYTGHDYLTHLESHKKRRAMATILLHKRSKSNSLVVMDESSGRVTQFLERPTQSELEFALQKFPDFWVNSGIYLFEESVLDLIPLELKKKKILDWPKDIFPLLLDKNGLYGVGLDSFRVAIDTPEKYQLAQDTCDKHSAD